MNKGVDPKNPPIIKYGSHKASGRRLCSTDATVVNQRRADDPLLVGSHKKKKSHAQDEELYGVVVSLKGTFGFIQTIASDEQIYFGVHEFYPSIAVGDKIGFVLVAKGSAVSTRASKLRRLDNTTEQVVSSARGTILATADRTRTIIGIIEIAPDTSPALKGLPSVLPYLQADSSGNGILKSQRIDRGDLVEFEVVKHHGSELFLAVNVNFVSSRRDRAAAVQVQRMLDAGVVKENGIVTTLRKGEYGFIRTATRKDEVYFRVEDLYDVGQQTLNEGSELEFFVIAESVKGKLSDRAIHLRLIPRGSVIFEYELGKQVLATVVTHCVDDSQPGCARLHAPMDVSALTSEENSNTLCDVELWRRCLPEELSLRIGDTLLLDVLYYRPEKLYFARNVKVQKYRLLGREEGKIIAVRDQGFGFVHSTLRNMDLYFRKSLVLGTEGIFVSESVLQTGMTVSFEVSVEDLSRNKLRAVRLKLESVEKESERKVLIQQVSGKVVKAPKGKESNGLIRINAEDVVRINETPLLNPYVKEALEEFVHIAELTEVEMNGLPLNIVRNYCTILEETDLFPGVICTTTSCASEKDGSVGKRILISKADPSQFEVWKHGIRRTVPVPDAQALTRNSNNDINAIEFVKDEYTSGDWIPLSNDLRVIFDISWDRAKNKHVAQRLRLTDEAATDVSGVQHGIIDMVVDKNGIFGFVRCTPSDEKLFFHIAASARSEISKLKIGDEVSFLLRIRGGVRCATSMSVLKSGSLHKSVELPEVCRALVVSESSLVLLQAPMGKSVLNNKYLSLNCLSALALADQQSALGDGPLKKGRNSSVDIIPSGKESGVSGRENPDSYQPKFYPLLPRFEVPFESTSNSTIVGSVVNCRVTANWAHQREPLSANVCSQSDAVAVKKRGRIVRSKFRFKAPPLMSVDSECALVPFSSVATLDFTEIFELEDRSKDERKAELSALPGSGNGSLVFGPLSPKVFYCRYEEIGCSFKNELEREGVQNGAEVEFWCVPAISPCAAFNVNLIADKSLQEYEGISFQKRPVVMDASKTRAPLNLISMAEGTPNDTAVGFAANWRHGSPFSSLDLSLLPWGELLSHLPKHGCEKVSNSSEKIIEGV